MDTDEKLKEIGYLDYLLEKTPAKTRLHLLKSNFDLWKSTFPTEASIVAQDKSIISQNEIQQLQTMPLHPVQSINSSCSHR